MGLWDKVKFFATEKSATLFQVYLHYITYSCKVIRNKQSNIFLSKSDIVVMLLFIEINLENLHAVFCTTMI